MAKFDVGDQVVYVPGEADGDINHPNSEFGFVTSTKGKTVFVRFFRNKKDLFHYGNLKNKANSESCNEEDLVAHKFTSDSNIKRIIAKI